MTRILLTSEEKRESHIKACAKYRERNLAKTRESAKLRMRKKRAHEKSLKEYNDLVQGTESNSLATHLSEFTNNSQGGDLPKIRDVQQESLNPGSQDQSIPSAGNREPAPRETTAPPNIILHSADDEGNSDIDEEEAYFLPSTDDEDASANARAGPSRNGKHFKKRQSRSPLWYSTPALYGQMYGGGLTFSQVVAMREAAARGESTYEIWARDQSSPGPDIPIATDSEESDGGESDLEGSLEY